MAALTLTASDHGATVDLAVGDELTVTLPEDSGGGYLWALEGIDGQAVVLEGSEPGPQTEGIGGRRPRDLTFRAVRAGQAEIHLVHRRAWEATGPESDRFDATVRVEDPSA